MNDLNILKHISSYLFVKILFFAVPINSFYVYILFNFKNDHTFSLISLFFYGRVMSSRFLFKFKLGIISTFGEKS